MAYDPLGAIRHKSSQAFGVTRNFACHIGMLSRPAFDEICLCYNGLEVKGSGLEQGLRRSHDSKIGVSLSISLDLSFRSSLPPSLPFHFQFGQ